MTGLQDIAAHLHQKTEASRRGSGIGFRGTANDMEKQIIEHAALEQQVYVLTDVVQATLQIIVEDHYRRSHRGKRALAWIREFVKQCERKIQGNVLYRGLAVIGTLATLGLLYEIGKRLVHLLQGLRW